MSQVEYFKKLMTDNKIIISGKNAEELYNFFKETGDMVSANAL